MTRRFHFSLGRLLVGMAALGAYISVIRALGGPSWRIVALCMGAAAGTGVGGYACVAQGLRMADKSNEPRLSVLLLALLGICLIGAAIWCALTPLFLDSV